MGTITITGLVNSPIHGVRKITAIKAFRYVTHMGLKESKDVIDAVINGQPYTMTGTVDDAAALRDGDILLSYDEPSLVQDLATVIRYLRQLPQHMNVAEVSAVLEAVQGAAS